MFKVKVLTVGASKEQWLQEALAIYEKRLRPNMDISWHLKADEQELERCLEKETSFIVLDRQGVSLSSEELSQKLFASWGLRLCFAIGGATGLSSSIQSRALFRWSFSSLTFTHQMTRLLLIEQLYRALEIERGHPYHK